MEWRGHIRILTLATESPGNFKNTAAWASLPESDISDLVCSLAMGLFYKALSMILMCI